MTHSLLKKFKNQPIVNIILASIVLTSLIPISILGYKLYDLAWENAWREITEKHQLLAENLSPSVSMYIQDRKQILHVLASEVADIPINKSQNIPENSIPSNLIQHLVTLVDGFHSITWATVEGDVLYNQFNKQSFLPIKKNLNNSEIFINATKGKWGIANLISSPISGKPVLLMAQPVRNAKNEITSILIAELNTAVLETLRKNIKFGAGGHSAFVDEKGHAIAHPNPAWAAEAKDLSHINVVQAMMAGKTGVTEFYSPFIKENMVVGYTSVPELGWGIMVPQPKSEVEKQVHDLLFAQLQWAGIGLAFALLLGIIFLAAGSRAR